MPTPAVNIRELKARLSHYLRLTKSGQVVEIRERGRPIGRIIPTVAPLEDRIDVMVHSGLVKWNRKRLPPRAPVVQAKGQKTVADLLIEDRE